jgi:crotonobetainyl-CoA:carnitine CoA-transferase CaiB-like acyl-CoA transferase
MDPVGVDGVRFLEGVRVLEIASLAPAMLGMHLADLGAEVVKVEPPGRGDATRLVARRPGFADSALHRRWNRGKRSVALDTTTPEGIEVLRRLIAGADIVIEGLRPGALERMGLGWDEIVALRPDVVFVSLSGYGQDGPYRDLPSHGIGFDALAGLADVEDDELGRPTLRSAHVYHGTLLAPLFASNATIAALLWSRRTGRPVRLDVAQADAAAFANFGIEDAASERRTTVVAPPAPPQSLGGGAARATTTQACRTSDGKVLLLMALERKFFVRLAEAVGRPDLLAGIAEDEHLARGSAAINDALAAIIATKPLAEWMALLAAADVPAIPINETADEVLDDPHLTARITWLAGDQGTVTMQTPVRSDPPLAPPARAAAVGDDTAAVLADAGFEPAEIARLEQLGVLRARPASGTDPTH